MLTYLNVMDAVKKEIMFSIKTRIDVKWNPGGDHPWQGNEHLEP